MKTAKQETNGKLSYFFIIAFVLGIIGLVALLSRMGTGNGSQTYESGEKLSGADFIGQKAPDFSLEDIEGKTVRLSGLKGKNVVLFFNEGEMCYPACWDQVRELGADSRLNTDSTTAYSIVADTKEQWLRIQSQMPQIKNAKILFDTGRKVSSDYDVLSLPSSMHRGSFPGHTYFLIDKEGIIRFFLDDPNMAIRNNQLIDEINKLQ